MKHLRGLSLLILFLGCSFRPVKELSLDSKQALFARTWVSYLNKKAYETAWDLTTVEFRETLTFDQWVEPKNLRETSLPMGTLPR